MLRHFAFYLQVKRLSILSFVGAESLLVVFSEELSALYTYVVLRKEREAKEKARKEEPEMPGEAKEKTAGGHDHKLPKCLLRFNSRQRLSEYGPLDFRIEFCDGGLLFLYFNQT